MKNKVKIFLIALVIILGLFLFFSNKKPADQIFLEINNIKIKVDIADELSEQTKGLAGKKRLTEDEGLLFVYPDYKTRSIWMKGMLFPIDIIWILDGTIVGIEKDISPHDQLKIYTSPELINYILEVNAGLSSRNNIKVGDKINLIYEIHQD